MDHLQQKVPDYLYTPWPVPWLFCLWGIITTPVYPCLNTALKQSRKEWFDCLSLCQLIGKKPCMYSILESAVIHHSVKRWSKRIPLRKMKLIAPPAYCVLIFQIKQKQALNHPLTREKDQQNREGTAQHRKINFPHTIPTCYHVQWKQLWTAQFIIFSLSHFTPPLICLISIPFGGIYLWVEYMESGGGVIPGAIESIALR